MDQRELSTLAEAVEARLAGTRERIVDAGGDPGGTGIVAVTKGRSPLAAAAALQAGLVDLGENYAQELVPKAQALPTARWHFIGNLQANKVRRLAPHVGLWQSVDRRRLLTEIARHSPGAEVLVQLAAESIPGRGGCDPETARRLVAEATALGLRPAGLMMMALPGPASEVRGQFRLLRALADELGLAVRSMGTSDDYPLAIEEGANLLRLGRVLLGDPRAPGGGTTTGTSL